ncbi:Protein EDS1 [Diplonema papillatum]|nr:Protein EDS1 [Diplonema papillatum]
MLPHARKLYHSARLSMLTYQAVEVLREWSKGEAVRMEATSGGPWFGGNMRKGEYQVEGITFYGEDPVGRFHKCQWLACVESDVLYVAFRGTDNATDYLLDAALSDVVTPSGSRVHSGFYSGVQNELPVLLNICNNAACSEIVFCGHSLGGAYATVAVLELTAHLMWRRGGIAESITFGQPLAMCSTAPSRAPALPSRLAVTPPKMTNFVANYDIVPRFFALDRAATIAFVEELPTALLSGTSGAMAAVVNLAKKAGYAKADAIVDATTSLRASFHPVGTYVFCSSSVVVNVLPDDDDVDPDDHMLSFFPKRATTVCVLPAANAAFGGITNPEAHALLRYMPSIDPDIKSFEPSFSMSSKADFIGSCLTDHSMVFVYWPIIEHLIRGEGCTVLPSGGLGLTRFVEENEKAMDEQRKQQTRHYMEESRCCDIHEPVRTALEAYEPMASFGVAEPSQVVMDAMHEKDRQAWRRLVVELVTLQKIAGEARDRALALQPAPRSPRTPPTGAEAKPCALSEVLDYIERNRASVLQHFRPMEGAAPSKEAAENARTEAQDSKEVDLPQPGPLPTSKPAEPNPVSPSSSSNSPAGVSKPTSSPAGKPPIPHLVYLRGTIGKDILVQCLGNPTDESTYMKGAWQVALQRGRGIPLGGRCKAGDVLRIVVDEDPEALSMSDQGKMHDKGELRILNLVVPAATTRDEREKRCLVIETTAVLGIVAFEGRVVERVRHKPQGWGDWLTGTRRALSESMAAHENQQPEEQYNSKFLGCSTTATLNLNQFTNPGSSGYYFSQGVRRVPHSKEKFDEKIEHRALHMHSLALLTAEAVWRSVNASNGGTVWVHCDDAPPGIGVGEIAFQRSDVCDSCGSKFSKLMNPRHHCRACGRSICSSCSPKTALLMLHGSVPARLCNACSHALYASHAPLERISVGETQRLVRRFVPPPPEKQCPWTPILTLSATNSLPHQFSL